MSWSTEFYGSLVKNVKVLKMTELEINKKKLESMFISLLMQYREYQKYFSNTSSPSEAELKYYCERFNESGYDSEGLFSLHHTSLFERMKQNKEKRKDITDQITQHKLLIRLERSGYLKVYRRKQKLEQLKKNGIFVEK